MAGSLGNTNAQKYNPEEVAQDIIQTQMEFPHATLAKICRTLGIPRRSLYSIRDKHEIVSHAMEMAFEIREDYYSDLAHDSMYSKGSDFENWNQRAFEFFATRALKWREPPQEVEVAKADTSDDKLVIEI